MVLAVIAIGDEGYLNPATAGASRLMWDAIRLAEAAVDADVRIDLPSRSEKIYVWHLFHAELKLAGRRLHRLVICSQSDGALRSHYPRDALRYRWSARSTV
jgi:hypothetical protein